MSIAALFPGFGSEYSEMFCPLSCHPRVGEVMERLDEAAGREVVISLDAPLSAQLAVFGASVCYWDILKQKYPFSVIAGHSLGLYGALYAAGSLSFEDGVKIIVEAQRSIESLAAPEGNGTWAMAAVIGLKVHQCERICAAVGDVYVSHVNSATQILISVKAGAVRQAGQTAIDAGALSVRDMGIPYPLHTPYMEGICNSLRPVVDSLDIMEPRLRVLDHTSGRPMEDVASISEVLAGQIGRRVLWRDTMIALGVSSYVEVGPSSVLAKLARWMHRDAEVVTAEEVACRAA
jgi:malonyl CoA-acyl carrier protein transacylase